MKKNLLYLLLLTSFNLFAQVPGYVPSDSLVGWWGFNGNANDESGNGNDGTVNGATLSSDRFGNTNSAYDFDGVSDFIEVAHNSIFNSNEISISTWYNSVAYSDGGASGQTIMVSKREPSGWGNSFETKIGTTTQNFVGSSCTISGSNKTIIFLDSSLTTNNWFHYVYVHDNIGVKIYLNGILLGDTLISGGLTNNSLPIRIGQRPNGSHPFNGEIDDIGIWSRALDSCEIKDLYNAGVGNCCTANPITTQPTDQTVTIGNDATIDFTDSLTAATYQWQMDAGTGYSDLSNAGQFSGTDTQTLTISFATMSNNNTLYRCIVSESTSCMDTTDVSTLTVIDNTSIGELNNSLAQLFPNPTNGIITINLSNHSNGQIILTDILGKEVLSKSFSSNEVQLNLKNLESKGTYFAKVLDSNGNIIAIKKLIYQ